MDVRKFENIQNKLKNMIRKSNNKKLIQMLVYAWGFGKIKEELESEIEFKWNTNLDDVSDIITFNDKFGR